MTMGRQVMNALGIDLNEAANRLSRLGGRAQKNGFRFGRRDRRQLPAVAESLPPTYLWIGGAVFGAAVLAAMMRTRSNGRHSRRVGDLMVHNVLTIEGTATLQEAAQRMREGNVGVLPVVEAGRLRGVVTDRDLVVRGMARGMDAAQTPVRYIATEDLACAKADWDIGDAMRVMSDCQVGRLPVVDDEERVIGMVTLSSLALRSPEERETLHAAQEVSRRSARSA